MKIEDILKEFDKQFYITCEAHERTSSDKCICNELKGINWWQDNVKNFLKQYLESYAKEYAVSELEGILNNGYDTENPYTVEDFVQQRIKTLKGEMR